MSLADIPPKPGSPDEPLATNDALKPWNVLMGNVALRSQDKSGQGKNWHYEARIEELGPDGGWTKIGLVDSKITEGAGDEPREELTRVFLQHRCAAEIVTLPQGLTLTIQGIGNWRFNQPPRMPGTRVVRPGKRPARSIRIKSDAPVSSGSAATMEGHRGRCVGHRNLPVSGDARASPSGGDGFSDPDVTGPMASAAVRAAAVVSVLWSAGDVCATGDGAAHRGGGAEAMCGRLPLTCGLTRISSTEANKGNESAKLPACFAIFAIFGKKREDFHVYSFAMRRRSRRSAPTTTTTAMATRNGVFEEREAEGGG